MWPWGHAALGYLLYRAVRRGRGGAWPPSDLSVVALAVGTQFPDIIDKPLAWTFHLLPSGRSLAHSLLTATLVCAVVLALARRYDHEGPAWAFVLGYYAHLLGDALLPLLHLDTEFLRFLLWPLQPPPPYEMDSGFVELFLNLSPTEFTLFGFALTLFAIGLWIHDGTPGLRWARARTRFATSGD